MTTPDPAPIIDLMDAFRRSKTMFAAVHFGIFDMLAEGPLTADEIAVRLQTDQSATQRLLEACCGLKLLERNEGAFSNTPEADAYLRVSSPRSLAGYILYSNQALYYCWGNLEDAVREGTPRWEQTFGSRGPIFDHFFSTPEKMRTFTLGMHGLGVSTSPHVVGAFDLSEFHTLADLGAATGHLAITACEAYPGLRGIAFDMPKVIPIAEEFLAASPARDRLSAQAGDFFTDPLPAADLYSLGRILHDWSEEKIRVLLRRIFEALPDGGGLLIAEKLLEEDRSGPLGAHLQSLSMLLVTEGKERSLSEHTALLEEAGFTEVKGCRTGRYLDAILARKRNSASWLSGARKGAADGPRGQGRKPRQTRLSGNSAHNAPLRAAFAEELSLLCSRAPAACALSSNSAHNAPLRAAFAEELSLLCSRAPAACALSSNSAHNAPLRAAFAEELSLLCSRAPAACALIGACPAGGGTACPTCRQSVLRRRGKP